MPHRGSREQLSRPRTYEHRYTLQFIARRQRRRRRLHERGL